MKRILDVGQCDHDHGLMTRLAREAGAEITRAATAEEALSKLRETTFDLVWVNRMFDADNSFGLELIKRMKSDPKLSQLPVMLISNFESAQNEAVSVGALPGLGKDHLREPVTLQRVKTALDLFS